MANGSGNKLRASGKKSGHFNICQKQPKSASIVKKNLRPEIKKRNIAQLNVWAKLFEKRKSRFKLVKGLSWPRRKGCGFLRGKQPFYVGVFTPHNPEGICAGPTHASGFLLN